MCPIWTEWRNSLLKCATMSFFIDQTLEYKTWICVNNCCEFIYLFGQCWMRIYLHTDGNKQAGLRQQGEGLIICYFFAIISDGVAHGCPRDEEEDEWAVAAVQQDPREGHFTEILVQLSRSIQLGVLETPAVIYVLHTHTCSCMNLLSM